ncbi:metallophosphoesterase family protein [Candidatus Harpocratesius sp.]
MEEFTLIKKNFFALETNKFHRLSEQQFSSLKKKNNTINPIIREVFDHLVQCCLNGFNFTQDPLSFEKYLKFYQEVNRLIPTLEKKIVTDDIYGPTYFIGDTHGAIHESYLIIEFFYKLIQKIPESKLIFVGDYVDRNPYDLENLTLIVAFSLLCPGKVVLIRGNHEDRKINEHYGFIDNLLRAFWEKGEELYEEIIQFFTHLPIAHISQIHSGSKIARVLTVHGGIPIDPYHFMEPLILSEIESKLECDKPESSLMDPLSVSMLWSDPDEMIQKGILTGDHFNGRLQFGIDVFNAFMSANNLDLLVRGHQKWPDGWKAFFNSRLYSLFSTASYDGRIQFSPKILKLEYGKPPKIINISEDGLNLEISEFQSNN